MQKFQIYLRIFFLIQCIACYSVSAKIVDLYLDRRNICFLYSSAVHLERENVLPTDTLSVLPLRNFRH